MARKTGWWLVAVMGLAWVPRAVHAQGAGWQADHEAGSPNFACRGCRVTALWVHPKSKVF